MNDLEAQLGLIEVSPDKQVMIQPTARNLKAVAKITQTYGMLLYVCGKDGMALKHASKRLITPELCEISVEENGLALQYVPVKLIQDKGDVWYKQLCLKAVTSNGRALQYVPEQFHDQEIVDVAILQYDRKKGILNEIRDDIFWDRDAEQDHYEEINERLPFPTQYVSKVVFNNREFCQKVVSNYPLAIQDIPKNRITKSMSKGAVTADWRTIRYIPKRFIDQDLIIAAIMQSSAAIRYIPYDLRDQELCQKCFEEDASLLPYIPVLYITKVMCLRYVECDGFSVYWDFVFIPNSFRDDKDLLDVIINRSGEDARELLEWNDQLKETIADQQDYRGRSDEKAKPLKTKTIKYLRAIKKKGGLHVEQDRGIQGLLNGIEGKSETQLPLNVPQTYSLVPDEKRNLILHSFTAEDISVQKIHYVSDIHVEHQLQKQKDESMNPIKKEQYIINLLDKKIKEMFSENPSGEMLLIAGDVADSVNVERLFYERMDQYLSSCMPGWTGYKVICVLGNHELWDGTKEIDWNNPEFISRPIEAIIDDYREALNDNVILLENELFIEFKGDKELVVKESQILKASDRDLTELLSKCTMIILGGIGFSGLNPVHNASIGLYRKTITSVDEDLKRSKCFRMIYEKVRRCASEKRVIVLTHTPVYDWTNDECQKNWIYINGHTHRNALTITADGISVLSDNQIGYKPKKWTLNSFTVNSLWYDPFGKYEDGIYKITSEQYKSFNRGRGIESNGCPWAGEVYMLKRNGFYLFLLKTIHSLCLLAGGKRKKLENRDLSYYYQNMGLYTERIQQLIKPYQMVMSQLSEEIRKFGGNGRIHGCIVDISFYCHIYVNPYDGKITPYWAPDMMGRSVHYSVQNLLKNYEPELYKPFLIAQKKKIIPMLSNMSDTQQTQNELAVLPQWMQGTEIYDISRVMRAIQYVYEQNVIRIWNDDILNNDTVPDQVTTSTKLLDKD